MGKSNKKSKKQESEDEEEIIEEEMDEEIDDEADSNSNARFLPVFTLASNVFEVQDQIRHQVRNPKPKIPNPKSAVQSQRKVAKTNPVSRR